MATAMRWLRKRRAAARRPADTGCPRGRRRAIRAAVAFMTLGTGMRGGPRPAGAAEYVPLYNINLMGGQYFFSGQRANFSGNANGNIAPVVKFSDQWSLMPIYNIVYQGTKQVTDSVEAGTLYQQLMDNRVVFMGLYTPAESTWRIKPNVNFMREFLKETRDESWGNGLFDYWKIGTGLEVENVYKDPFSYRMGYDFFYIRYPDYQSLESQSGVDPFGNPLGRQNAGRNTLNTLNNQLSFNVTAPYPFKNPKVSLQGSYSVDWQTYPDQPIIDANGQPTPNNRQDFIHALNVGLAYPTALKGGAYRLLSRFGVGLTYDESNQHDYDATFTKFIPYSYSYAMWSVGPAFNLAWGDQKQPSWLSLGFTFSATTYPGRLAQDASGQYTGDRQWQDQFLLGLAYSYPIAPHFSLKAQTNYLWSISNQNYQALYAYTYRAANFLCGFTYDY